MKENDKKEDAKVEQNKVTKFLAIALYSKSNLSQLRGNFVKKI